MTSTTADSTGSGEPFAGQRPDPRRSRPRGWWPALALIGGLTVAAAVVLFSIRQASLHLLQRDAEHTALAWGTFASQTVQGLDRLLVHGELDDATRLDLQRFRRVQEVFRFKLFDREGRTVLVSDDLDKPRAVGRTQSSIGHGSNDHVRTMVLGGTNYVELKTNADNPARPPRYSEAYVPLLREGQLLGVVEVYVDQTERAARIQTAFALVAAVVFTMLAGLGGGLGWVWLRRLRRERVVEERMRYLARHDMLSGLLNRASFGEAVAEASWRHGAGGPAFSVLCLDLDHFKDVNDGHGHAAGDAVLRQVGERLRGLIRHGDRVARLGGDEFAILQSSVSSPEDVTTLADRVVQALHEPYEVGGKSLRCGASIGAAIFGRDAASEQDLMHKADLALYRAKHVGRGGFSFYDAELDRQLEERRGLTNDLRAAIGTEQLSLHYQPLFAGDGHTLKGYEALMRWHHPVRGPQSPAVFIPLAEDTGIIDALGRWGLQTACKAAATWPDPLSVAVNLSAAQFKNGDLVEMVAQALDASGLPARRLQLEITESLLMSNTEQVMQTLHRLAAMGVRIAMDDFGTGYSSLAYLWRFPFDKVKIDRAFTQHLDNDPKVNVIVRSIISLAHSLDIEVNAEGVETRAQQDALHSHGCDELQGFLLGRPMPDTKLAHAAWPTRADGGAGSAGPVGTA